MLGLVCLTVDDSFRELRLKNFKDVERVAHVKVVDELISDFENKSSLLPRDHLDSPKF